MDDIAHYHLPGLFEFYELYRSFLPIYKNHPEYFYDWCDISSIYGAPSDCLWGGGRVGFGDNDSNKVIDLLNEYDISPRLTFSNSLLSKEHLSDTSCNDLCRKFHDKAIQPTGIVIYSDMLLEYLQAVYPNLYYISSTTKVITDRSLLKSEVDRPEFHYVVPDFRLNHDYALFETLTLQERDKLELLCNECCFIGCAERKECYESVSRRSLGEPVEEHICNSPYANEGYRFSRAMQNASFISIKDILNRYLPMGISNFKIEGRSLGSAMILEFLLYYITKPEYHIHVREEIYLDCMLDLF